MSIREGTLVSWPWGNGRGSGRVVEVHRSTVRRTLDGAEITRHGTNDDPAYLIEQDGGARVLKLRSEVERA